MLSDLIEKVEGLRFKINVTPVYDFHLVETYINGVRTTIALIKEEGDHFNIAIPDAQTSFVVPKGEDGIDAIAIILVGQIANRYFEMYKSENKIEEAPLKEESKKKRGRRRKKVEETEGEKKEIESEKKEEKEMEEVVEDLVSGVEGGEGESEEGGEDIEGIINWP